MHQVFRREANDVRFALPCKCARNNLFKCKSVTILWMRIFNIYALYVFDTLPQQLIENHIENQKHPQKHCSPILLEAPFAVVLQYINTYY